MAGASAIRTAEPARRTDAEWRAREQLAAFYRWAAHAGLTDLIYNHISLRVPGQPDRYLVNPYGLLFEEITASSLVMVSVDGEVVSPGPSGLGVNPAVHCLHGAVLKGRPDINCVAHIHTPAVLAVVSMECGLLPMNQTAMRFNGDLAYHDYGSLFDEDEPAKLLRAIGSVYNVILRHHGLLCLGRTVPEAFLNVYNLETACRAQALAMAAGTKTVLPPPAIQEESMRLWRDMREQPDIRDPDRSLEWQAIVRLVERIAPDYRT
jgi:ribulose-5-phosphate 4-epimerase/fuculose-1-phosphate aldolase